MIDVLLKTLPFFAIVGLGYGAARMAFFPEAATAYLTKFVFYFALPAMTKDTVTTEATVDRKMDAETRCGATS